MWFHKKDLTFHPSITNTLIRGYVLPHAGTKYTGKIISHTLRFKPTFKFNKVCIIYYPSSNKPNIANKYYHEYYVPMKSLQYFIEKKWTKKKKKISYYGVNVRDSKVTINLTDTLIIVSADFSHFLPLQQAIPLENKAAHALMFQQHTHSPYINIVDDVESFKALQSVIPSEWVLQWIGRSRSPGEKGVGYLSFLLKEPIEPSIHFHKRSPTGMFVTCYDINMNARECLGKWFTKWTPSIENKLIHKVIHNGSKTSRLTGGHNKHVPIKFYTITYLYLDHHKMIRGYHGIKQKAFYLPDVLLEHTFTNGSWFKDTDKTWKDGSFRPKETLDSLHIKSGKKMTMNKHSKSSYKLYRSEVLHIKI